ncbi:hypothetical protein [Solimonas soli]|uniref:hypothetical protein n=1 Tax=Solimonas soli TaxID=413479 RepID=UPI0004BAC78B|nr:hypothetical protein [Solimonas soli]
MRTSVSSLIAGAALLLGAHAAFADNTLRPEVGEPLQKATTLLKAKQYKQAMDQVDAASRVGGLSSYESSVIAQMRAAIAASSGDTSALIQNYESRLPSLSGAEKTKAYGELVSLSYRGKNYVKAADYLDKYRAAGGSDPQVLGLGAQIKYEAGDLAGLNAQIAQIEKGGQRPSENQLLMVQALANKKNDTTTYVNTLEKLVTYYPKDNYWKDLLSRAANKPGFSDRLALDVYRLKKLTGTMDKTADYMEATQLALQAGVPGEAEQYIKQGYDKKLLGQGSDAPRHQRLKELVDKKVAEAKASMAADDKAAAGEASGDALVSAGLTHVGFGEYDAGIALIQQGIRKDALKKPDDAKLHLGYAQLLAGKKDAAAATLKSVQGKDGTADLARLYQLVNRR